MNEYEVGAVPIVAVRVVIIDVTPWGVMFTGPTGATDREPGAGEGLRLL